MACETKYLSENKPAFLSLFQNLFIAQLFYILGIYNICYIYTTFCYIFSELGVTYMKNEQVYILPNT